MPQLCRNLPAGGLETETLAADAHKRFREQGVVARYRLNPDGGCPHVVGEGAVGRAALDFDRVSGFLADQAFRRGEFNHSAQVAQRIYVLDLARSFFPCPRLDL